MKKAYSIIGMVLAFPAFLRACPACEAAQPKLLRGITHGAGPQSRWDFLIVSIVAVITILTLYYSVKWLIRPGELSNTHIKRQILS